ncbi:bZIP transcription factor [Candidatus Bathyarchaeota archaeon]|nr:bZIP transcription factor [Candidatus Bathyarchaeota archaeon]
MNRTHRERKEFYVKTLEDELLRLKESFTNVSQDKEKLADENMHLKALLQQNGIAYGGAGESPAMPSLGYTSSGSVSGNSYMPGTQSAFTPPPSQSLEPSISPSLQAPLSGKSNFSHPGRFPGARQLQNPPAQRADTGTGLDYDQAGIDFVLRYGNCP